MSKRSASEASAQKLTPSIALAIGLFTALTVWMHVYFAQRLVVDTALPAPWGGLVLAALTVLGGLIFARPLAEHVWGATAGRALGWPAHVWLGCCFYLLLGLWLGDAVSWLLGRDGVAAARAEALWVCGTVALIAIIGMRSALRVPRVVRVEHVLAGWPRALDGYRIVQISDLHIAALLDATFARKVVERCNALQPDLVAITGDLVDGRVEHFGADLEPLAALKATDGSWFITGNHDHYAGGEPWVERVAALGIHVLRNRRVRIAHGEEAFELAGVEDYSAGDHDLEAALLGWNRETPLVLLAHDPRTFAQAKERGVQLQLSGHTHDGQLWPFRYFVRLQTPYVSGSFHSGRSKLYVSRGTGFWGPPMRVLAPAEITEHVLRAE